MGRFDRISPARARFGGARCRRYHVGLAPYFFHFFCLYNHVLSVFRSTYFAGCKKSVEEKVTVIPDHMKSTTRRRRGKRVVSFLGEAVTSETTIETNRNTYTNAYYMYICVRYTGVCWKVVRDFENFRGYYSRKINKERRRNNNVGRRARNLKVDIANVLYYTYHPQITHCFLKYDTAGFGRVYYYSVLYVLWRELETKTFSTVFYILYHDTYVRRTRFIETYRSTAKLFVIS